MDGCHIENTRLSFLLAEDNNSDIIKLYEDIKREIEQTKDI